MIINVYTDGSGVNNPSSKNYRLGGIGSVFVINNEVKFQISKGYRNTTSSRAELLALIISLQTITKNPNIKVNIFSDSEYVIKSFTEKRLQRWANEDFKTCKNPDLMELLWNEYIKFNSKNITFSHVRGHKGNEYNELADKLANYKNFTEYETDLIN